MDFEITKREVLVSIIITFLLLALGIWISSIIQQHEYISNERFYKFLARKPMVFRPWDEWRIFTKMIVFW